MRVFTTFTYAKLGLNLYRFRSKLALDKQFEQRIAVDQRISVKL